MAKIENTITLEQKAEKIAEKVKLVAEGGKIKILCGEGTHKVYNQPKLIDAFRYARDVKQSIIQVVIGPVVSIDDKGINGLLDLKKEGKIEMYYRLQRGALFHFGVFEKGIEKGSYSFLDIEMPHKCLCGDNERRTPEFILKNREAEAQFWADKFSIDFDYWIEELINQPPKEGVPIKFTDEQFARFLAVVEKDGKDFNSMGTEEILRYKETMLKG